MKRSIVLGAGLLILLAGVGQGQEKKGEVRVERDLVYGKGGDTDLQLDLAMPKDGDGPFPAIVCIHGGGWRGGNRQNLAKTIEVLAGRGYVAATISYRLVPKATFPAQIEDSKAAVRWLRANAKKYKVDPDHIGAVGYSAGGHLCCLLGVTAKDDRLEGKGGNAEQSSQVQAVVSFFGPTDFTERTWNATVEKDILAPFLGGSFEDKRENYKKASPVSYVRKSAPPFLFFHGTEDKVVAVSQSRILAEKLRGVGASAKLVEIEGAGHGWGGEKLLETVEQMVKFFDANLKKK
jgi:acetyl esterase/lipase